MKKTFLSLALGALLGVSGLQAAELKGLNVLVVSPDAQTQTMAMVLSTMTLKKHGQKVNMVLCGPAGALATKEHRVDSIKRPDGSMMNAKKMLENLIKGGANVALCPIYLPNAGKTEESVIEGVSIAKPPMVAKRLLSAEFNNVTF